MASPAAMKIGLVSAEYPPAVGGVGDHTERLARELAARGHDVMVVTSAGPPGPPGPAGPPGAPERAGSGAESGDGGVAVARAVERWDWRILAQVPRLARQHALDVLHVQYQPAAYGLHGAINLLPSVARLVRGRPALVTTFHDLREPYLFPKAGGLRRMAVRLLARRSDAAIAVAEEDLPVLRGWTAWGGAHAVRVPLGNQLDAAPPADFHRERWRETLGLAASDRLVGYLGLVNRSKGVAALIEATAGLVERGAAVRLLMIGDQVGTADATNVAYLAEVRARIEARGLRDRVHWTGHASREAIAGWLRCLDVVALPFEDGATLRRTSLIAAWGEGVPVVTTAPRYDAAWSRHDPPAAFVPAADPAALGAAIEGLLADPARCAELARAGRRMAAQFDWSRVVAQTEDVYRRVAGAGVASAGRGEAAR